ncbi:MAG: SRPBCC family protein [Burkholderiales bacterium]
MKRSVEHGTFVIEREFSQPPARVFAAFADPKAKAKWFAGPPGVWQQLERRMDFRVGGTERARGRFVANGRVSDFQARYQDIVPDRRIVYSYNMYVDEKKISVSLATIEFEPAGRGTKLVLTEQGAFLDGYDDAGSRERGTLGLIAALEKSLEN